MGWITRLLMHPLRFSKWTTKAAVVAFLWMTGVAVVMISRPNRSIAADSRFIENGMSREQVLKQFGNPLGEGATGATQVESRLEFFSVSDGVILVGYDDKFKVSFSDAFEMNWFAKLKWRYFD
jgi:hypothetical protein